MFGKIGTALVVGALVGGALMFAPSSQASANVVGFWGRPYPAGYAWGAPYNFGYAHRHCVRHVVVETPEGPVVRRVYSCGRHVVRARG